MSTTKTFKPIQSSWRLVVGQYRVKIISPTLINQLLALLGWIICLRPDRTELIAFRLIRLI
jgi:hypothetical protein